jgi:hypothetical protein
MNQNDLESLRQIIISLFQILQLQQGHLYAVTVSLQTLLDLNETCQPEFSQKYHASRLGVERKLGEDHARLIKLMVEQEASLKKIGRWVN